MYTTIIALIIYTLYTLCTGILREGYMTYLRIIFFYLFNNMKVVSFERNKTGNITTSLGIRQILNSPNI